MRFAGVRVPHAQVLFQFLRVKFIFKALPMSHSALYAVDGLKWCEFHAEIFLYLLTRFNLDEWELLANELSTKPLDFKSYFSIRHLLAQSVPLYCCLNYYCRKQKLNAIGHFNNYKSH